MIFTLWRYCMLFNWRKIKLIFKIIIQTILHPIDTYRTYKFYRRNKNKIKIVLNEIKPLLTNFTDNKNRIEEYIATRFKELGIRDELIVLVDYLAEYLEKTDTETIIEIVKDYVLDEAKVKEILENLTPEDIQHYKVEAITWLKTL